MPRSLPCITRTHISMHVMAAGHGGELTPAQGIGQDALREWTPKTRLRAHMRVETPLSQERRILHDRLARWQVGRQMSGKLPPDWELPARHSAIEKELGGRARKGATALDAVAVSFGDAIDKQGQFGPGLDLDILGGGDVADPGGSDRRAGRLPGTADPAEKRATVCSNCRVAGRRHGSGR